MPPRKFIHQCDETLYGIPDALKAFGALATMTHAQYVALVRAHFENGFRDLGLLTIWLTRFVWGFQAA